MKEYNTYQHKPFDLKIENEVKEGQLLRDGFLLTYSVLKVYKNYTYNKFLYKIGSWFIKKSKYDLCKVKLLKVGVWYDQNNNEVKC